LLNQYKSKITGKTILVKFLKKIEGVFDFLRIHQYKGNESDNFDALVKSNVDG
jgi:hypothetical protein